jgi:acyl-CoA synthetase (AMP-forming)/AMP-acid ligase II
VTDTSKAAKSQKAAPVAGSTRFALRPVPAELGERYLAEGLWDDRTLGQLLSDALYEDPTRRFRIWSPTNPYLGTVGEVYEEALRVAAGLRAQGFGPGDIVAFQLPNWFEAAVTFYACTIVGVTIVPIVIFYGPKEVGFILRQSGARAFIVVSAYGKRDFLAELSTIRDGLDDLETVFVVGDTGGAPDLVPFDTLRDAEPMDGPVAVDPDSPAVIGYTSGTTADPKGVVHTHRTLGCEVRQLSGHQANRDRASLVGAPVGHAIGMLGGLLCPLVGGKPIYMIDGWDPPTVLAAMVEEDISAGSGSTFFFTSLLDSPDFTPQHVELMHFIGLGGSPIPDAVAERAEDLGISLVRSYGSTEHPSITGSEHEAPREKRIHTDGKPLEGVEIRTVDEAGHDVGVGQPGEIISRGPDRFAGYTDPALNAEAIEPEGWLHTGDIGIIDADGYLTITDRLKDIIIRGGENVSAAEVEQLLAHMKGVAEVAVVAAPDERLGEHGCAFFRMQPGVEAPDLEEVKAHLSDAGLARQKWPEELRVVDELPRTPSGKIQKFVLRDRLRAGG